MTTRKRFIVDLLDDDNNNETEQFIRKYGADEITGMTNGDVIKALFPHMRFQQSSFSELILAVDENNMIATTHYCPAWWNAPYEAESEDKECK